MNKYLQAALSLAVRVVVIGAVAGLDFLAKQVSGGAVQLPDPTITIPIVGLVISEADTWLINWEKVNGLVS